MKIYFVAGETSGDNHGAELLRALRARDASLQFFGRGGPKMRAIAGGDFRNWIDQAGVVGLWEVLKHYRFFRREFERTIEEIIAVGADAVVLIDYPGFNLRLARALRKRRRALKIIYYISPQVWAWNQGRVKSMAHFIDLMLCIFPFEPELYKSAGMRAVFVGHPMMSVIPSPVEESRGESLTVAPRDPSTSLRFGRDDREVGRFARDEESEAARDQNLIGIFPGSRVREVKKIFPIMLAAAREILRSHAHLRFEIAAASEGLGQEIGATLGAEPAQFSIVVGRARDLMSRAAVGMVASGTATLEAALSRLPFVLVYRVAWPTYLAARLVVKVKYLGMPNVLANRAIVPEFIQHKARPVPIARAVLRLLDEAPARAEMRAAFESVSQRLGAAEANAADAILAELPHSGASS